MHSVGLILMPRWYIYIQNGGNRNLQMKLSVWRDAGSSYKLFALLRSYTLLFLNPLRSWIAETFFWYEEIINKSICYWSFLLPPTAIAQLVAGLSGKHRTMLLHPLPSPNYMYVHDRVLVKKREAAFSQASFLFASDETTAAALLVDWLLRVYHRSASQVASKKEIIP